jgi:TonB family protein
VALRRACARARTTRWIELRRCPSAIEPGVAGLVSPRILWPAGLSDRLSDEQLEAVLAHEVCHVVRRDNLGAAVQMAVEIVFWFHPLVWWIGARMVAERERACDEEVVRMGTNERSYAEGILKVCGFCLRAPAAFRAGIGVSHLTQRIERILTRPPGASSLRTRVIVPALLIVTAGAPIAAGAARGDPELAQPAGASDRRDTEPSPATVPSELSPVGPAGAMPANIAVTEAVQRDRRDTDPAPGTAPSDPRPVYTAEAMRARIAAQGAEQNPRRDAEVVPPRVLSQVTPSYTASAMRERIEGSVLLEAVVLEDGRVGDVRVVRSLDTEHGLDDQAIAALRQWRFAPATRDGKPVSTRVTVQMHFTVR